jgi:hypothetical protein
MLALESGVRLDVMVVAMHGRFVDRWNVSTPMI